MLSKLAATFLPRHLRHQLAWLTSLVLLLTIFAYAWYSANKQSAAAQNRAELRVVALAQSIAAASTTSIINKDFAEVESLLVRMVGLPNIQEARITDARGRLLSHVVRKPGGKPEIRFGSRTIDTPAAANAATRVDYSQPDSGWRYQFGLGDPGQVVVWLPIFSGTLLGWVVVDHDLASTAEIRKDIWLDSLSAGTIALIASILLLLLFLKRPMGALQTATNFADRLDESRGAQLPVFHGSSEIESLTTALNRVSTRLLTQNRDLNNQQFALDQHAIVSIADLNGNITYANDLFCKISGYSQAELIGQNHRILNSGFHQPEVFIELWRTISQGDVWHGELKNRNKDGGYYWVDATIVPLMGADGRPQQYIAIRTDVTAIKDLAHLLMFHSTMEALRQISVNMAEIGDDFHYKVLRAAMSLSGANRGAMVFFDEAGNPDKLLTEGIPEEGRQEVAGNSLLQTLYREGGTVRLNSSPVKSSPVKNSPNTPVSSGFLPGALSMKSTLGIPLVVSGITKGGIILIDKHGGESFSATDEMTISLLVTEAVHVMERSELMATLHNSNQALTLEKSEQQKLITQLKEAQSHLLQAEKMASIGQLAAGVAHEINNPIGFVYSNLGTLEKYVRDLFTMLDNYEQAESGIADTAVKSQLQAARQKLDINFIKEDLRALMDESKDGITQVKNIVQNLKDFSHVDAADVWQYADLHMGINSTLNIVNNEIKYKADVVREYGDIPQVECLPSQLNQVFMNLLVNASHAIEERGTITIRSGWQSDEVWVDIVDSGKGVAPEHIKKIFDPFFTTKPVGKGTGLGLSLSYGIIQKHHGRIEVQSEVGKGTTFRVWLPIRQPQIEQA